jgi:hypothetical protein
MHLFMGERRFVLVCRGDGTSAFTWHEVFSGLPVGLIGRSPPISIAPSRSSMPASISVPNAPTEQT